MTQRLKATVVFEKNWDAIHENCPKCLGLGHPINKQCDWCGGSGHKYKYIINEGSSRSSKTRSLIQVYWLYPAEHSTKRLTVWRHEKKLCKDTVGYDMGQIYPSMPNYTRKMFNATEFIYKFDTGSTIEVCGTDDADKVMGFNQHVAWLNEPYSITKDTFDQIDQRTEDFIIIDWNPKEAHWIDDLKKDERAIVIKSTFRDNPFCPPEQKRKILSYQPVSKCTAVLTKVLTEQEAKVYDLSVNNKGLSEKLIAELSRCKENERKGSASEFNWSVYGLGEKAERPNRIFFWEEISDDAYNAISTEKYYGVDWGTVDPWGILEVKYYDGGLYLHQLNYKSENEIKEELDPIDRETISKGDEGLVTWMFGKLNINKKANIICDNNRPLKITALWEAGFDYATAAPKPPGSIIDGITGLTNMKVYFTSSSTNLKYEQENYQREVDRYGVVLEEPIDKDNHLIDPTRYVWLFMVMQGIIKIN